MPVIAETEKTEKADIENAMTEMHNRAVLDSVAGSSSDTEKTEKAENENA
jgi:hypothetical protein